MKWQMISTILELNTKYKDKPQLMLSVTDLPFAFYFSPWNSGRMQPVDVLFLHADSHSRAAVIRVVFSRAL